MTLSPDEIQQRIFSPRTRPTGLAGGAVPDGEVVDLDDWDPPPDADPDTEPHTGRLARDVGGRVASILASAHTAADALLADAEREAAAVRSQAWDEASDLTTRAEAQAEAVRRRAREEAAAVVAQARREADALRDDAARDAADQHERAAAEAAGLVDEASRRAAEAIAAAEADAEATRAEATRLLDDAEQRARAAREAAVARAQHEAADAKAHASAQAEALLRKTLEAADGAEERAGKLLAATEAQAEAITAEAHEQARAIVAAARDRAEAHLRHVASVGRDQLGRLQSAEAAARTQLAALQAEIARLLGEGSGAGGAVIDLRSPTPALEVGALRVDLDTGPWWPLVAGATERREPAGIEDGDHAAEGCEGADTEVVDRVRAAVAQAAEHPFALPDDEPATTS